MADLAELFRWQWMWKSRPRLIAIAVGALVFGLVVIAFSATRPGPFNKGRGLAIFGGLMFAGMGGYQLLQGLFSPAGAFGDHDAPDPARRTLPPQPKRTRRRDDEPLPLAPDTGEAAAVKSVRCPTCHEPLTVEGAGTVECPKCQERFVPD